MATSFSQFTPIKVKKISASRRVKKIQAQTNKWFSYKKMRVSTEPAFDFRCAQVPLNPPHTHRLYMEEKEGNFYFRGGNFSRKKGEKEILFWKLDSLPFGPIILVFIRDYAQNTVVQVLYNRILQPESVSFDGTLL